MCMYVYRYCCCDVDNVNVDDDPKRRSKTRLKKSNQVNWAFKREWWTDSMMFCMCFWLNVNKKKIRWIKIIIINSIGKSHRNERQYADIIWIDFRWHTHAKIEYIHCVCALEEQIYSIHSSPNINLEIENYKWQNRNAVRNICEKNKKKANTRRRRRRRKT